MRGDKGITKPKHAVPLKKGTLPFRTHTHTHTHTHLEKKKGKHTDNRKKIHQV